MLSMQNQQYINLINGMQTSNPKANVSLLEEKSIYLRKKNEKIIHVKNERGRPVILHLIRTREAK